MCTAGLTGTGSEHDSGAVFVPWQVVSLGAAHPQDSAAAVGQADLCTVAEDPVDNWASVASTPPWHPPDTVLDASYTYLTLRHLRI